jgi:hypothetical protein
MNTSLRHFLTPVARILGLLLIITPLVLPLAVIPHALLFSPNAVLYPDWGDYLLQWSVPWGARWDVWAIATCYISDPKFMIPSLAAFAAGLWLWRYPLSWKNILTGMVVAVPWFLALAFACLLMAGRICIIDPYSIRWVKELGTYGLNLLGL